MLSVCVWQHLSRLSVCLTLGEVTEYGKWPLVDSSKGENKNQTFFFALLFSAFFLSLSSSSISSLAFFMASCGF